MSSPVSRSTPAAASARSLRLRFGADDASALDLPVPVLAGSTVEALFPAAQPAGTIGGFTTFRQGRWMCGWARLEARDALEQSTRDLYAALLGALPDHVLVRVWNYVPGINEAGADGLENYRAFCRARSEAFESRHGPAYKHHASAASAVGCGGDDLIVAFAAHSGTIRHVENPRQVPAYDYPAEYGPRAPTFARASVADLGDDTCAVFISGTSSIRGYATVAAADTPAQVECTLENLREISRSCGLDVARATGRQFKVYLRHAGDLAAVQARLESALLLPDDRVTYLRADICRRELNIEIEASVPSVRPSVPR